MQSNGFLYNLLAFYVYIYNLHLANSIGHEINDAAKPDKPPAIILY